MSGDSIIEEAVSRIWNDLTDRQGVGDELEGCDEEIQLEIKSMIKEQIASALQACLGEQF